MNQVFKTAFTLIELLVVIAIIGILSGLIVVLMNGMTQKATIAKAQIFSNSLRNSLMMNMIAEWKFDELTTAIEGTPIQDSWGKNNGTLDTYTTTVDSSDKLKSGSDCVSGKCLSFDGINDYIYLGNDPRLQITTQTICGWVKTLDTVFYLYASRNGSVGGASLFIGSASGRQDLFIGSVSASAYSITEINDNVWHLICATLNDDTNEVNYYLDGNPDGSAINANSFNHTVDKYIGFRSSGGTNHYLAGLIDDVRIYNVTIPTSQIKEQYFIGLNSLLANGGISVKEYIGRINSIAKNE